MTFAVIRTSSPFIDQAISDRRRRNPVACAHSGGTADTLTQSIEVARAGVREFHDQIPRTHAVVTIGVPRSPKLGSTHSR